METRRIPEERWGDGVREGGGGFGEGSGGDQGLVVAHVGAQPLPGFLPRPLQASLPATACRQPAKKQVAKVAACSSPSHNYPQATLASNHVPSQHHPYSQPASASRKRGGSSLDLTLGEVSTYVRPSAGDGGGHGDYCDLGQWLHWRVLRVRGCGYFRGWPSPLRRSDSAPAFCSRLLLASVREGKGKGRM